VADPEEKFQSTPVIANGRIFVKSLNTSLNVSFNPRPLLLTGESGSEPFVALQMGRFQSTPVIANGRIHRMISGFRVAHSFNPRPLLLTGESRFLLVSCLVEVVSIHARYC